MQDKNITFSVASVIFSPGGHTERIQVYSSDGRGFWIEVLRNIGIMDITFKPNGDVNRPLQVKFEGKLRRLVKDYDKLGKRSIDL